MEPRIYESTDGSPSCAKFFRELITAIQEAGVKAYICIRNETDKKLLIQHFEEKETPLTNYEFLVYPSNSIWIRDFGPINFYYGTDDQIGWVDLNYFNKRKNDDNFTSFWAEKFGIEYTYMPLNFEGGNILMNGQKSMTTSESVYSRNTSYTKEEIDQLLKKSFNLDHLYVLKELKYDGGTGHIDLYIDMNNENRFIYTKQSKEMATILDYEDYQTIQNNIEFLKTQTSQGGIGKPYLFGTIPFPTQDNGSTYHDVDKINRTNRTYSNHLIVNKTIIQPVFNNGKTGNITGDKAALDIIKKQYPGYKIIQIDARYFEGKGGSVHCVTKEFHAENPIRFKHYPYSGKIDSCQYSYPVDIVITNKSGIDKTTLFSRKKGDPIWKQTTMNKGASHHWTSKITLNPNSNNDIIEYYFSAISNNGKTMTYPMTGAEGGAYSFWCTSNCSKKVVIDTSYTEDFEGKLIDWTQKSEKDWQLKSGKNHYLYIDNTLNSNNEKAILESPCFDLSEIGAASFNFNYFFYGGNDQDTLQIEASDTNGYKWKKLWQTSNTEQSQWKNIDIDLHEFIGETVQLRIIPAMNPIKASGVKIDDLSISVTSTISEFDSEEDIEIPIYDRNKKYQDGDLVLENNEMYIMFNNELTHIFDHFISLVDFEIPPTPSNLTARNITETSIDLRWNASTDNSDNITYDIYQDNTIIGSSTSTTSFNVTDLSANTVYSFFVQARDEEDNISYISNVINIKTLKNTPFSNDCSSITKYQNGSIYFKGEPIRYKRNDKVYEMIDGQEIYLFDCTLTFNELKTLESPEIIIYPNPVKSYFSIGYGQSLEGARYSIFDLNGKMVGSGEYQSEINIQKLNLTSETSYFLKLYLNDRVFKKKFIKK